jgi:hypothetical protein
MPAIDKQEIEMSKVVKGGWDEIPHSERVIRWERVFKTLDDMSPHAIENHFDMAFWGKRTDCGTVGCAAGQCGLDPWFKRRGFEMRFQYQNHEFPIYDPMEFFGVDGYTDIFLGAFEHTLCGIVRSPRQVHAAVKRAVRKYIAQLKREA